MILRLIKIGATFGLALVSACAPQPPQPSPGHLQRPEPPPSAQETASIPAPVELLPYLPPPEPAKETELYTVVVDKVPVRELLFALARDASLNVDIHPQISGEVTINAIDQTLPQILDRIAKQINLRYEMQDHYLSLTPDFPFVRHYQVDYVNVQREVTNKMDITTQVAQVGGEATGGGATGGGASGGNNSTTSITNTSKNNFWESLLQSVAAITSSQISEGKTVSQTGDIVINKENGLLTVRATARQHEEIQTLLDRLMANAKRQVLIEATIAEVLLNDRYQAGVNWQRIAGDYTYTQNVLAGNLGSPPAYVFTYHNPDSRFGDISAALRLLEEYGSVKVLSSPKIMSINNQTAVLRVVDNEVYFTVEVEERERQIGTTVVLDRIFTTEIHTVPEGIIISVTPNISENGVVTMNVRPTISRIVGYITDPNPNLAEQQVVNAIPQVRVREIESILQVNSGEIAVIGGLMQDSSKQDDSSVPGLSKLPIVGDLFKYRNDEYLKSELVIFLRPTVIKNASVKGDLKDFQPYLPNPEKPDKAPPTGLPLNPEQWY